MRQRSTKLSLYALVILLIASVAIAVILNNQDRISANPNQTIAHSIPFKVGENDIALTKPLDLSGRVIGLNGSLITLEEARRRGIIEGFYDRDGLELTEAYLLSPQQSFIIRVKDISSSPALFF